MKKMMIRFLTVCLVIAVALSAFFGIRKANFKHGKEQGYLMGYAIGYADKIAERDRDEQMLAGSIVPYEYGNSKWSGFMMGFPTGYAEGQSGNIVLLP